ncbi:MAG: cytochrome c biogenesis protein CcdA [Chloroflexota bacterium]
MATTAAAPDPVPAAAPARRMPTTRLFLGLPLPAAILGATLLTVGVVASGYVAAVPFDTAAFGGLTVPTVLAAGVADGFNPCAFALLVLFATYTLTLVNSVTSDGSPTLEARRRLLGAGSLYVGAVWVTYFVIGLGLLSFLGFLGRDHLVTRVAVIIALIMALWMLKDVLLPGVGPSMMAGSGTHGRMQRAMERGGLTGMLIAGVLVGICTVPCSGAMYLSIVSVLHASGGGLTGMALLALYNIAFIVPLLALLLAVSDRRVLGKLGRWNRSNSPWIKVGLALAVIAMSFGLMVSL